LSGTISATIRVNIVFNQAHDILSFHEGHFQVELGELWLPVAALVFIPKAAGDLEIALDPGNHQQLLELLRGLR
jgi:hypothetical protein